MRPISSHNQSLKELARLLSLKTDEEITFTGVTSNSKLVHPGDLFLAMPGFNQHGAHYLAEAKAKGAVAVLTDVEGARIIGPTFPVLVTNNVRAVSGEVTSWFYNHPLRAMQSVGITGTNGKTTTASLLFQYWQLQSRTVGMIGTIGTIIDHEEFSSTFTTPEASELQAIFASMRERALTHMVMEVSSHSLAEGRIRGSHFDLAAFTNLSQDHLDYHETMENYFNAKKALFTFEYADAGIINIDDPWGERLVSLSEIPVTTLSLLNPKADWHFTSITPLVRGGYEYSLRGVGGMLMEGRISLIGEHNLFNMLMAVALGYATGLDPIAMAHDSAKLVGAPGRLESVDLRQDYLALVDFAHTPDAVQSVLRAVRAITAGKIIAVLGCGGDRDPGKRPLMGQALVDGSDIAIFTSDNPRSEDPAEIIRQMLGNLHENHNLIIDSDRRSAIALAIATAEKGDTVIILGKGHEKGQEIQGIKVPFDDRIELAKAIEALA